MSSRIQLLDCTLRDGAYIVNADFGSTLISGLLKRLYAAEIDIIECGWLKDAPHAVGSSFFHLPGDAFPYLPQPGNHQPVRCAMIDWDRYDLQRLPHCDARSIDAIRMVFPHGKASQAIALSQTIVQQGYRLFFQAANTLAYANDELRELAARINDSGAEALSIVDTFGAMYPADLERIFRVLDDTLLPAIKLGFHSHNNQQLSFALTMRFAELGMGSRRNIVVDASLNGMGRGAGNATTELVASYLNRNHGGNYDLNEILDAIDTYIEPLKKNYSWGYSTPYFIAGYECCHVNNIAYLRNNHRTLSKDMRLIIEALTPEERTKYDYDKLEAKFVSYSDRKIDDGAAREQLRRLLVENGRPLLLLAPGKTLQSHAEAIQAFIRRENPLVVGINSIPAGYDCDFHFFSKPLRYQYAAENSLARFAAVPRILTSNVKTSGNGDEYIVNYNLLVKLGWLFFDDSMIMFLRLLERLGVSSVYLAGFDGFPLNEPFAYADPFLQGDLDDEKRITLNQDIASMLRDVIDTSKGRMDIQFLTPSRYGM